MQSPLIIFEDNQGCISFGKRCVNLSSMKHIDLKYNFQKEEIANNVFDFKKVESAKNIADIFTKALSTPQFRELRTLLNVKKQVPQHSS